MRRGLNASRRLAKMEEKRRVSRDGEAAGVG